jgi:hypothetical protein
MGYGAPIGIQEKPETELRTAPRVPVSLPVLVHAWGRPHNAKVHNLSCSGALLESPLPIPAGNHVLFSCGSIEALGTVVWKSATRFGVRFRKALDEELVTQQIARSEAAAVRQFSRPLGQD